jgi:hypothetical protein
MLRRCAVLALSCATLLLPSVARADVELPTIPEPVPVTLDPSTTAFLVLDIGPNCLNRPACVETVPAISRFLGRSRAAGAFVIYTTPPAADEPLPEVAPRPGDPRVAGLQDKYHDTNLEDLLVSHGIQTLVLAGTSANGSVLYTSYESILRGYTVVVAVDAISSSTDFQTFMAEYQIQNVPTFPNTDNQPLKEQSVTLSRLDQISYAR